MTMGTPKPSPPAAPSTATIPSKQVRVLVVDDSAFMRKAISELIKSDPSLVVIDTARNGEEAIEKVKKLQPDVVTLDIEMPVLNGHEALKRIRAECRDLPNGLPAILVCSSLTSSGSHDALQAMQAGAADVIAKDASFFSTKMDSMRDELVAKIKAIATSRWRLNRRFERSTTTTTSLTSPTSPTRPAQTQPAPGAPSRGAAAPRGVFIGPQHAQAIAEVPESPAISLTGRAIRIVVIGSSTGGPPVLEEILANIPVTLPCPVVIAQHMPVSFTKAMSERLDGISPLSIIHGEHGMPLHPGTVYIVPGGRHGRVRAIGRGPMRLEVSDDPKDALFRPSVTELLRTAAEQAGDKVLGVVLTGIGDDGKPGGAAIKAAGGVLLAQDPTSSVVYGMPKAAFEVGGLSMTPENIAKSIASLSPTQGLNRAA